ARALADDHDRRLRGAARGDPHEADIRVGREPTELAALPRRHRALDLGVVPALAGLQGDHALDVLRILLRLRLDRVAHRPPRPPGWASRSRSRATFTVSGRPPNSCWFSSSHAVCASSSRSNSTKAKPFGRPVSRSVTTRTSRSGPISPKRVSSWACVAAYGRLPM